MMKMWIITGMTFLSLTCMESSFAVGKEVPSWKEWLPATSGVSAGDISAFQNKLPSEAQTIFNKVPLSVQRLSVVVMLGLKAANAGVLPENGYYMAFKIANKAAAGFYLDKAIRTIEVAE